MIVSMVLELSCLGRVSFALFQDLWYDRDSYTFFWEMSPQSYKLCYVEREIISLISVSTNYFIIIINQNYLIFTDDSFSLLVLSFPVSIWCKPAGLWGIHYEKIQISGLIFTMYKNFGLKRGWVEVLMGKLYQGKKDALLIMWERFTGNIKLKYLPSKSSSPKL